MKIKKKKLTNKNLFKIYPTIKYRIQSEYNAEFFPFSGLKTYVGAQGMGKTISAVVECKEKLDKYPNCIFITNVKIKDIKNETYFFKNATEFFELIPKILQKENKFGYLILIDEIHIVFENMFRNGIDGLLLELLSQQRKNHVQIIGTAQMYSRLPRGIREYIKQSGLIIESYIPQKICKFFQLNFYYKMELLQENSKNELTNKKIDRVDWYFHTKELYESYDTFASISMLAHEFEEVTNQTKGVNES